MAATNEVGVPDIPPFPKELDDQEPHLSADLLRKSSVAKPPLSGRSGRGLSLTGDFEKYAVQATPKGRQSSEIRGPEDYWICPLCTLHNPLAASECQMCQCARPHRTGSHAPSMSMSEQEPEEVNDDSTSEPQESWACVRCTFANSLLSPICQMCGELPPMSGSQNNVQNKRSSLSGLSNLPPLPDEGAPVAKELKPSYVQSVKKQENKQAQFLDRLRQTKNKKQLTKKLNNSISKLREELKTHNKRIQILEEERMETETLKESEIDKWGEYAQFDLVDAARSFFENKLLLIAMSIRIEEQYRDCFSNKIKTLMKVSTNKSMKKLEFDDYVCAVEAAMTTASHIRLPKSIRGEAENQKALEKVVDNYEKKYVELMAAQSCNTDDIKTDEFREVLDDVMAEAQKVDNMWWYPLNQNHQLRFESILFDVRHREGRYIKVWTDRQKDEEDLSYQKINQFLERLTNTVCDSYKVDFSSSKTTNEYEAVRLLTHRAMMSRIFYLVADNPALEDKEKDEVLKKKVFWMRSLKQEKLHIKAAFCLNLSPSVKKGRENYHTDAAHEVGSGVPYAEAIRYISAMRSEKVADDCVVHLVNCITNIEVTAKRYADGNPNCSLGYLILGAT